MDPRDEPTVPDAEGDDTDNARARLGRFELGRTLGTGGMGIVFEAQDTLLERAVALKILKPGHPRRPSGSLLGEAKALARLVHPNVVTVFDVGTAGADVFIAMELVDGAPLHEWCERPHTWREILDVFVGAGRGLAAVHALGLVHRDFKPSNVLIDRAGTPKVGDFGLVCPAGERAPNAMGTPSFMAPEQEACEPVDGRADQYAFSVALERALGTAAPSRLRPILTRARAADPAARYPSMTALLQALVRARRGPLRAWLIASAAATAIATAAVAWSLGAAQHEDPCPAPDADLAAIWSDDLRDAARAHLVAIDPAHGPARFAAITRIFDPYVQGWRVQHVAACRATRVLGSQSDAMLDRRMACLDRDLADLRETAQAIARAANPIELDGAIHAVVALPSLDACADTAALTETVPPPTEAGARREFRAIADRLAAIDVARRIQGRRAGLEPDAVATVARARQLAHPGSVAAALMTLADIQVDHEETSAAIATFGEAMQAGAAAHDDRLVATAWLRELGAIPAGRVDDLARLLPAAAVAVTRAGDHLDQRFDLRLLDAQLAMLRKDFPAARAAVHQATQLLDAPPPGIELASLRMRALLVSGTIDALAGEWALGAAEFREYLALAIARLGPDHPDTIRPRFNLAVCLRQQNASEAALAVFEDAARIGEARLAPSPNVASLLSAVSNTLRQLGRSADALPYAQRALAMARATMPADDLRLAPPLEDLGGALQDLGRGSEARPLFVEAIAVLGHGPASERYATDLYNLAYIEFVTAGCRQAIPVATRALAMAEQVSGKTGHQLIPPLTILGDCAGRAHQWAASLGFLERALALPGNPLAPWERVIARLYHGRTLVESGRDVAGGMREVRAARAAAVDGVDPRVGADIDTWLAGRARRAHASR